MREEVEFRALYTQWNSKIGFHLCWESLSFEPAVLLIFLTMSCFAFSKSILPANQTPLFEFHSMQILKLLKDPENIKFFGDQRCVPKLKSSAQ